MTFQRVATALVLLASFAAPSAQADVLQFRYTAKVKYATGELPGVAAGDLVTGQFAYDPDTPFDGDDEHSKYYYPSPMSFGLTVGGHTISSESLQIHVVDGDGSDVGGGDAIFFSGWATRIDGVLSNDTLFGITLYNARGRAFDSASLPRSYDLGMFNKGGSWQYGEVRVRMFDGNDDLFSFSLTSLGAVVPEPGGWLSMLAGLGLVTLLANRRRRA